MVIVVYNIYIYIDRERERLLYIYSSVIVLLVVVIIFTIDYCCSCYCYDYCYYDWIWLLWFWWWLLWLLWLLLSYLISKSMWLHWGYKMAYFTHGRLTSIWLAHRRPDGAVIPEGQWCFVGVKKRENGLQGVMTGAPPSYKLVKLSPWIL